MSAQTFDADVILDGNAVLRTTWTDDEITQPTMFGPLIVEVDNGSAKGAARDLTASFDFYSRNASDVDRFVPGVSLYIGMTVYEPGSDRSVGVGLFTGVVNEVTANVVPGRPGYIRFHVIGTDDKRRVSQDEITTSEIPRYRMAPDPAHPAREETGGLWTLDQFFRWDDTDYMKFRSNIVAGNAWNDDGPKTNYFPYKFGMSINDPFEDDNPIGLMSKVAEVMNLRMFCESGYCGLQVARYKGSPVWEIDSRYVSSAQGVGMKLYSWTNTWSTRFSRIYREYGDRTVTNYTSGDVEKYGTIGEHADYSGTIYEFWEDDESAYWPNVGSYPLSMAQLNRQRAYVAAIQQRRNINEVTVHLTKLRESMPLYAMQDFLGSIFEITRRLQSDPYIPTVEITGPLPAVATSARGIVEKATLTITPRKNMPPKADLDLTLGQGDGKPGDAEPIDTNRWAEMGTITWSGLGTQIWNEV